MREFQEQLILLDTHVWIWLLTGDKKLKSSPCLSPIEQAVRYSNIRISAISVWEVGMLEAKGRLQFPMNCLGWVHQALSAPGISLVPLSPEIAIESTQLPGDFYGDPADRIIVATARILKATLITHDKNILNYAKQDYLNALPT